MEVKPIHILAASFVAFLAIVAANVIVQYQNNSEFRDKLTSIDPTKIRAIRTQLASEGELAEPLALSEVDEGN